MHNESQPHFSHSSSHFTKSWYKHHGVLVTLLMLVIAVGVAGWLFTQKDASVPAAEQKLTLYYNDDKTVLWQTGQDEGDNAAFIAYTRNQLKLKHGDDFQSKGTWKVTTTLDKALQDTALQQFTSQRRAIARADMTHVILAAEDVKTGHIVALAIQQLQESGTNPIAERVPAGTLATPLSYIALLEKKPESAQGVFEDTRGPLPGYPCTNQNAPKQGGNCLFNMDMRYLGPISLSQALGGLRNVTAAKAANETGQDTYKVAAKMGSDGTCYVDQELTQKTPCYLAAAFGEGLYVTPQRLLQAYATLANKGAKVPQSALLKTVLNDKQQYIWKDPHAEQVIHAQTAITISDALADPSASFVQGSRKNMFTRSDGGKVSVVSGFTQDSSHGSSIQFTNRYAVGFWGTNSRGDLTGDYIQGAALPMASALIQATK